jgi:hypothetical protein
MGIVNINETLFSSIQTLNGADMSNNMNLNTLYNVCITVPPNILSDGIWGVHKSHKTPFKCSLPMFLLQVVLIYTTTRILNFPFKKLGLPILFSQMMVTI